MSLFKNPPALTVDKAYESWRNEVLTWQELTDLPKPKRALAIALSLTDKAAREYAMEINVDILKADDGVDKLLEELDKLFQKDKVDLAYSAYKRFDNFARTSDMAMSEFIVEFEKRYNTAKKHVNELPDTILAFKLLDSAGLDDSQKQLALTACTDCKFSTRKSSLNRIFGGKVNSMMVQPGNNDITIKEEVFFTRGNRGGSYRGRNYRGRGSRSTNSGNRGYRSKQNPVINGSVSRCNICDSTFHFERNCPHRDAERQVFANNSANADQVENEEEVSLALMSLAEHDAPYSVFVAEAQDSAVLDTACTKTVCGRKWLESFIDSATKEAYSSILFLRSKRPFRFGDAPIVRSIYKVLLPVKIGERKCFIESEVVDKQIPLLLSKESLKRAKTQMDLTSDNITMFGSQVASFQTTSGHYAIPLTLSSCLPSETVLITAVDSLSMQSDDELSKSLLKIHKQFGHASFDRLIDLLRRCSQNISPRLKLCLETVVKSCDVCSQRTQPCPRPVVSLPLTSKFNEIVSMDLHQLGEKLWYFHIIDLFTRQSAAEIIRSKSAETIIEAFFKCWICVYGVPKVGVFSDNGGEFNNSQFREMCSLLNISVKTSAGYSPWSNGVAERGNAILTEIVHKVRSDQNVSWETALAWAIYAKNNL